MRVCRVRWRAASLRMHNCNCDAELQLRLRAVQHQRQ
jgi:hypothetical protein